MGTTTTEEDKQAHSSPDDTLNQAMGSDEYTERGADQAAPGISHGMLDRARSAVSSLEQESLLKEVEACPVELRPSILEAIEPHCGDSAFRSRIIAAWGRLQDSPVQAVGGWVSYHQTDSAIAALRALVELKADGYEVSQELARIAIESPNERVGLEAVRSLESDDQRLGDVIRYALQPKIIEEAARHCGVDRAMQAWEALIDALDPREHDSRPAAHALAEGAITFTALSEQQLNEAMQQLWSMMFINSEKPDTRQAASDLAVVLSGLGRPATRMGALIDLMEADDSYTSQTLDHSYIRWGLSTAPVERGEVFLELIDRLKVKPRDKHLVETVGSLMRLVAGSSAAAGELITQVAGDSIARENAYLRDLRIAVGGEIALSPVLRQLDEDFLSQFTKPINHTLRATEVRWEATMTSAGRAFAVRLWMSVIVFTVGLALSAWGAVVILVGQREDLWGPGVTFAAGFGAMLALVFNGPVRQIREATEQLGTANIGYITFIHRINLIVRAFIRTYRTGEVSLQELRAFEEMLGSAADQSLELLTSQSLHNRMAAPKAKDQEER